MAEALYRKYRPQTFADVVGQDHVERTVRNAIEQDKLSHAYLFCGPRGTGKTTTARLLAKALLCEHGPTPDPDGTCQECLEIAAGTHPDVYELDAASRTGVENVREEIIGRVQFAPSRGRKKIYIIDEVHMLSTAAFNALLKTLEEPPSHVVFILCTTDPQKVPETIHSRCQRFDFRRIGHDSIVSRLGAVCVAEGVEFEGEALDLIAHRAEGGMRNALTALEQVIAFGEGKVTLRACEDMLGSLDVEDMAEIVSAIGSGDVAACFTWTARYIETGADLAQFARDLAEHFRNMYVMSLAGADVSLDVSDATKREIEDELASFGPDRLANALAVLGDLLAELRTSTNPRLSFEIALTRLVRPESDLTLSALAARVEALEDGRSVVASAPRPATAPAQAPASTAPQAKSMSTQASAPAPAPRPAPAPAPHSAAAPAPASAPAPAVRPAAPAPASSAPIPSSPVPEAAPSVPSSSSQARDLLGNPAALQRTWQAALNSLKRDKPAYSVMFLGARVDGDVAGESIVVTFPAANSFAYMAVQKPDVSGELASALQRAAGFPIPFRIEKESGTAPAPVPAPAPASTPQPAPFEARPVSAVAPASGSAPVPPRPSMAPAPAMPSLRRADGTRERPVPAAAPAPMTPVAPSRLDPAVERDMPRPAPKSKQVLPLPGGEGGEPRYVREGIRPKDASSAVVPTPAMPNLRRADGSRPVPAPATSAPVPDPDRVPLDAYDAMGYAEEDVPPWEEPSAHPAAKAPAPSASASATVAHAQRPADVPSEQPRSVGPAPDELNDLLSTFGEGVVFEEIER